MTAGHKHRTVRLRHDGLLLRVLQHHLITSTNRERVTRSRLVWGVVEDREHEHEHYVLTLLSVLHTLFGLTVETYHGGER